MSEWELLGFFFNSFHFFCQVINLDSLNQNLTLVQISPKWTDQEGMYYVSLNANTPKTDVLRLCFILLFGLSSQLPAIGANVFKVLLLIRQTGQAGLQEFEHKLVAPGS